MTKRRSSVGFTLSPMKVAGRRSMGGVALPCTPTSRNSESRNEVTPGVFMDVPANNDEEERRQRKLSRLQQLQSARKLQSSPGDAASDRRKSLAGLEPKLTGQQLAQHYAKCIQLSAENKINIKNAFNLQLIDYMTEMLRRKDSDMNNFQVASCTLDASTKIYAYRVDCVHTDTLRMAGGLGMTQGTQDGEDPAAGDGQQTTTKGKKRRTKRALTIESNPNALTLSSLDLEFNTDPLFKKIAAQFDEGRAGGGLFLSSLMLRDDSCQLLLDAEAVLDSLPGEEAAPPSSITISVPPLPDLSQKEICPIFSNFHFKKWDVNDEESFFDATNRLRHDGDEDDMHAFDVHAVPEPLDDVMDVFDRDVDDGGDGVMDDLGTTGDTLAATLGSGGNNTCLTIGGAAQHQASLQHQPQAMETVHLKDHLATIALEYSYFDTRVMSAWAGPGHWKLKPAARDKVFGDGGGGEASGAGKKRKKVEFVLEYRGGQEQKKKIDKLLEVTRRSTKLSHNTLKLWSENNTTLPVDLHYNPSDFFKLYLRPEVAVRRLVTTDSGDDVTATTTTDRVDNTSVTGASTHDCDDDDGDADDAVDCDTSVGYDMTIAPTQTDDVETATVPQQHAGIDFMGDNLVAAPNKVTQVNIGYARTAKRVDMKKLKTTLWGMLTSDVSAATAAAAAAQNKENDANSTNKEAVAAPPMGSGEEILTMTAGRKLRFSQVYKSLPHKLPTKLAQNLSMPLAFIALLHLCNDHNLAIIPSPAMDDFCIMQG